jgi:hypothetical protein
VKTKSVFLLFLVSAFAAALLVGAVQAKAGTVSLTVTNPGFEGNLNGWSYIFNAAGTSAQDGFVDFTEAHTGQSSLELVMNSGGSGVWQNVSYPLPAGAVVQLGWWLYMPNAGSQSNKWFNASLSIDGNAFPTGCQSYGAQDLSETCTDGAILSQVTPLPSWTYETLSFTLPSAASSIAFEFNTQDGNGSGPAEPLWVDDVTLQATGAGVIIPEPSSLALFCTGLMCIVWRIRQKSLA